MKASEFKKIIKKHKPQVLIEMFMDNEIFLTTKQLQKVIDLKKGTSDEGHGGVNIKYRPLNDSYDVKIQKMRTELSVKCKCGHSIFMPSNIPKVVCVWCSRTVYNKNELGKKQKFKDELRKTQIKRKKEKYENKNNKLKN